LILCQVVAVYREDLIKAFLKKQGMDVQTWEDPVSFNKTTIASIKAIKESMQKPAQTQEPAPAAPKQADTQTQPTPTSAPQTVKKTQSVSDHLKLDNRTNRNSDTRF